MRVYVIPPQAPCHVHDMGDGNILRSLQSLVDGYIETCAPVQLREQGIQLLCNEEGLLRGLPFNINLFPFFYVGTLVAVGVGGEEFISLTQHQIEYLQEWVSNLS